MLLRSIATAQVFLWCFTASATVTGGRVEAHGADTYPDHAESAWFLGDRPIRFCLTGGGAEFGVPAADVRSVIEEVFSKWKSYVEFKAVMRGEDHPEMALDFNHRAMNECDGTEDLKFYLGTEDAQVSQVKKTYNDPVAFAHRTRYDVASGWGRGFIWIAGSGTLPRWGSSFPDWQGAPDTLFGAILHEIGHVLGNSHVQDTIMSEDIADMLVFPLLGNLRRIDWGAELAENRRDNPSYIGKMSADPENRDVPADFRRIVGRSPVGPVQVTLIRGGGWSGSLKLVFEDWEGWKTVPIAALQRGNSSFIRLSNPVFKRACPKSACDGASYHRLRAGYDVSTVEAADGTVLPVFLEFNLGTSSSRVDAPVAVKFWENGRKHDLFVQTELQ